MRSELARHGSSFRSSRFLRWQQFPKSIGKSPPSRFIFIAAAERTGADGVGWIRNAALILYLTPVIAGLITMLFDRQMRQGYVQRAIAVVVITFATSAAAIANLISGTHPFKRNSVVPYQAIFDFIDRNANGRTLVVSTDPVAPWVLRGAEDRCAGYFLEVTHCLRADRRYDSIFVISGHTAIQSTCCRCHGRTEEASKRANRPRRGCVIEKPADRCAARRKYFDGRLLPVSRSGGERIIPYWPCARLR